MSSIARTKVPLVSLVLAFSLVAYGHRVLPFPILPDARVFIDPMDGFGPELHKALLKDGVPLVIVSDRRTADFEITGSIRDAKERLSTASMTWGDGRIQEAVPHIVTVTIVSVKTGNLAWGYGMSGMTDLRAAADSCAKQLKDKIKRGRMP